MVSSECDRLCPNLHTHRRTNAARHSRHVFAECTATFSTLRLFNKCVAVPGPPNRRHFIWTEQSTGREPSPACSAPFTLFKTWRRFIGRAHRASWCCRVVAYKRAEWADTVHFYQGSCINAESASRAQAYAMQYAVAATDTRRLQITTKAGSSRAHWFFVSAVISKEAISLCHDFPHGASLSPRGVRM